MADGHDSFAAPGRHTRRPGPGSRPRRGQRPSLRRVAGAALVMLVLQYGLGMILSFYVAVPAADAHAGIFTEIATAPLALTAHALLGVTLIGTAILMVARAMAMRDRLLAVLATGGLAAIVGAFMAGEMFVKNGQDSLSFAMAMLTGTALLCYIATLVLATRTRPAPGQETEPLLVSVPAARTPDLEDDPDGWGTEPGWDDDPDWAQRLRQDADPGWPGRPAAPQRPAVRPQQPAGWAQRPPVRPQHRAGQAQFPRARFPRAQLPQTQLPQAQFPQAQRPQTQRPHVPFPQAQRPQAPRPPDWWERP